LVECRGEQEARWLQQGDGFQKEGEEAGGLAPLDARVAEVVEERLGLQARHGFGPPRFSRDRAEAYIDWERADAFEIRVMFDGLDGVKSLGIGIRPPDRKQSFVWSQLVKALDPKLHARSHQGERVLDDSGVVDWVDDQAALFETHAATLLRRPEEVFALVRAAEPLGEQCERLVQMCREVLRLESDYGFDAPQTIHWRHECEISFARASLRLVIEIEDHEKAGVLEEPFTVPELSLHRVGSNPPTSLTETIAQREPDYARRRPLATRYAMTLDAVRPWLEHDAAFLQRHPELLA
jgi:hypothetical protein